MHAFTRMVTLATFHDVEVEARFSTENDDELVSLDGISIGKLVLNRQQTDAAIGAAEADRIEGLVQDWWTEEGHQEAAAEEAAERGDYLYHLARDEARD